MSLGRQPGSTVVFLAQHEHVWVEIGAEHWPNGAWCPVYECEACEDAVCDVGTVDHWDPGCEEAAKHLDD